MTSRTIRPVNGPANYKQVLKHFNKKPREVKEYFPHFQKLVENFPLDVGVSYVFSRIEAAKHMTVYCGIVKLHRTNNVLTRQLLDKDHMTRKRFLVLFKTVFGKEVDPGLAKNLHEAELIRDRIVHGKTCTQKQQRKALADIFDFAVGFNKFVRRIAGFKPFGSLQGFKGRKEPLPQGTTQWVLRGMGIPAKTDTDSV